MIAAEPVVLCRNCSTHLTRRGPHWVGPDRTARCADQGDFNHQPMPYGLHGAPDPAATIRYLTLHQPWAWLIAAGYKNVENRTWYAPATDLVGIHAGNTLDRVALETPLVRNAVDHWCGNGYVLGVPPWERSGAVLAVLDGWTGHLRATTAGCTPDDACSPWAISEPGTWHHTWANCVRIDPVPARGAQRLWTPRDPATTTEVLRRRAAAPAI